MRINRQDTNGVKPLLGKGELGYDDYTAGGDTGRVYVGNGSENIPQAKKSEVVTVDGKIDTHIGRVDNPHTVTKAQVGLGSVDNTTDASKNVLSATKLTTTRNIALTGDITGNVNFDGSGNVSIATAIAANSVALGTDTTGNYVAGNTAGTGIVVSGTAGEGWSPTITLSNVGTVGTYRSVTTDAQGRITAGTNPTTVAGYGLTDVYTKTDVDTKISNLVDSSPETLNTLNELAAALGDDPNFATTVTNSIGTKVTANTAIAAGTGTKVTYDTKGLVTSSTTLTATDIPSLDTGKLTTGILPVLRGGTGVTTSTGTGSTVLSTSPVLTTPNIGVATGSVSGNAGTATKLATARTVTLTGDVGGSASFDGSANISITAVILDDSHNHTILNIDGLQDALDSKIDDSQVLTNVPIGAVFTDTTYIVGDGQLTEKNFTSVLNTKLVGIETGATADQTAAEIKTALLTVDGAGSGIDADLLDGQHGSYYSPASHNHTLDSLSNTTITTNTTGEILKWSGTAWVNNTLAEADIQPASTAITTANVGSQAVSYATSAGAITSQGSLATLNTVGATEITDNSIGAAELNVVGNGTTSQYLRSDGDGTFTWVTPTDTNTTYTAGTGLSLTGTVFANTSPNVSTNLTYTTATTTGTVNSSDGTNAIIPAATTSLAGLMTNVDKTKLDGVATGAQVNVATNLSVTAGTTVGPTINSSTGTNVVIPSASASASGIIDTTTQTIAGAKTFSSTITGSVTGNSGTATKLTTARTISLTGDTTGSTSFDGSGNVSIATTITPNSVELGTDTTGNYVSGATAGTGITISGTAGEGWSPTISLTNVGAAGTYRSVTTDAQGRVTAGTNPTTLAGYAITDAQTASRTTATFTTVANTWYRIATSAVDIGRNSAEFVVDWTVSSHHGSTRFVAGCHYGEAAGVSLMQTNYSKFGTSGITEARIVYHTTLTGNYAYVEVKFAGALTNVAVNVEMQDTIGWSLVSPSTAGSVPAGYTSYLHTFVPSAAITAGTYPKVTINQEGRVTSGTTLVAADIPVLDASKITTGTLPVVRGGTGVTTSTGTGNNVLSTSPTLATPILGVATGTSFNSITGLATVAPLVAGTATVGTSTLTARQDHIHPVQTSVTGNAGTATTLQTARTINGVSFNGSANITISDSTKVALTGNETIAGIKTFSSSPIVPTPTTDTQATNKQYVDGKYSGFKNYIINGNFDVWQRGTSQTYNGYGSDDRWINMQDGSTKTHTQVACTNTERALFNASYFSRTVVQSVAGALNYVQKLQYIEDITRLSGKTVTLSFWAKADTAKNIGFRVGYNYGSGGTPSSSVDTGVQLIGLTTTWQKKSIVLPITSLVGKTLGTEGAHTSALALIFMFDEGNLVGATGVGQQSGTFDIAQVQLEEGSVATPFEQRPIGLELSLCQRYLRNIDGAVGMIDTTPSNAVLSLNFGTPMRVSPTTVFHSCSVHEMSITNRMVTGIVSTSFSTYGGYIRVTMSSSGTAQNIANLSGTLLVAAEL